MERVIGLVKASKVIAQLNPPLAQNTWKRCVPLFRSYCNGRMASESFEVCIASYWVVGMRGYLGMTVKGIWDGWA